MAGVARVEAKSKKDSDEYDWEKTVKKISRSRRITQKMIAFHLKVSPSLLSQVSKGTKPMPEESIALVNEKYADCVIKKNQGVTPPPDETHI